MSKEIQKTIEGLKKPKKLVMKGPIHLKKTDIIRRRPTKEELEILPDYSRK